MAKSKSQSARKNRRVLKNAAARRLRRKRRVMSRRNRTAPGTKTSSPYAVERVALTTAAGSCPPASEPSLPRPLPDGFELAGRYLADAADSIDCSPQAHMDRVERLWGALTVALDAHPSVTAAQLFCHLPGDLALTLQHSICESLQDLAHSHKRAGHILRRVGQGWLDRFVGEYPDVDIMVRRALCDAIELTAGPAEAIAFVSAWLDEHPDCASAVVTHALIDLTDRIEVNTQRSLRLLHEALATTTDTETASTLYAGIGSALQKAGRVREASAYNMRSHEIWCSNIYHGRSTYTDELAASVAKLWPLPDDTAPPAA